MQNNQATARTEIHSLGPEDFEWVVLQYQKQIFRVILFLSKDADAAEILTQECFLRAYKKHGSFRKHR
jgi:DNA-directed RNA polymerase specialized sigma24 family protein